MTESELMEWLQSQQPILDRIISDACREFHEDNKTRENFAFDLTECQIESYHLSQTQDLCYDRPNTPFNYALWYHGRRVNTFLSHFAKIIFKNAADPTIDFFDLGAGTGAVQWGIGLVYHKLKEEGLATHKIKIVNIDTSPFMLYFNRDYLWKHFKNHYTHCQDFDSIESPIVYEVNSWNNTKKIGISNPWITASYLFDISDIDPEREEYKKAAVDGFKEIIEVYNPSQLLLLTATSKEKMIDKVAAEFDKNEFLINKIKNQLIYSGTLNNVNTLRSELYRLYINENNNYRERSIGNPAVWDEGGFIGAVVTKIRREIFFTPPTEGIKLYNTSIKIRHNVKLNDDQEKAARNINQPSVIIGPAGCGKSIVITERIKKIVNELKYDPNLSILLTTFNRELLGQLSAWLEDILDPERFTIKHDFTWDGEDKKSCSFQFKGSKKTNIRLLHFDMLPKELGQIQDSGNVKKEAHIALLTKCIDEVKNDMVIDDSFDNVLNPTFLLEEYHRVVYGLQVNITDSRDNYLKADRKGRGTKLLKGRRDLVWMCLSKYEKYVAANKTPCFTVRRQSLLDKLNKGQIKNVFDYIFVDEFQDCTKADFEIFFGLLDDPNHLIIAGDLAQAVQLGKSASVELLRDAIRKDRAVNDISWNYLIGSYRLPFRICEAIIKISEFIHTSHKKDLAASILTPYKGAPPGARPIVVYAADETNAVSKLNDVFQQYQIYDLNEKCILEKDKPLKKLLNIQSDTVLRLKGMEKHCVIWSTRIPLASIKEKYEFVYTILSRTSSILIILLFPDAADTKDGTQDEFKEIIGHFRRDRLILWDKETKDNYDSFCGQCITTEEEEED